MLSIMVEAVPTKLVVTIFWTMIAGLFGGMMR